jgi:hypothetical protein
MCIPAISNKILDARASRKCEDKSRAGNNLAETTSVIVKNEFIGQRVSNCRDTFRFLFCGINDGFTRRFRDKLDTGGCPVTLGIYSSALWLTDI